MQSSKLQAALLGGLLLGVLSALPIVKMGNACCCLWVLAGGAVAAYLLQHGQADPITSSDGAGVGFLAGVFGAVVWQVIALPIQIVWGPIEAQFVGKRVATSATEIVSVTFRETDGVDDVWLLDREASAKARRKAPRPAARRRFKRRSKE